MNVMLIIKYSSTVMQGKRNLREGPTRFFNLLKDLFSKLLPVFGRYSQTEVHSPVFALTW